MEAEKANKAQHFLIDKGCGDLILNDKPKMNPENRIYASDIMMEFAKQEVDAGNQEREWVSIKDRLPSESLGKVLIYRTEVHPSQESTRIEITEARMLKYSLEGPNLFWMPLPKPPIENLSK